MDAQVAVTPYYWIRQIDGMEHAELLWHMNGLAPERFPPLQSRHLSHGFWWVAQDRATNVCIGFSGLVPFFDPGDGVGYLKRAYVLPDHRGQGLQLQFMLVREAHARNLGYYLLVSECAEDNESSKRNFLTAGYSSFTPEQVWGEPGSTYFRKRL